MHVGAPQHTHALSISRPANKVCVLAMSKPTSPKASARPVPAGLRETRVTFKNTVKEHLVGTLLTDTQGKWENVVILCHGYASCKDGFIYPQLSLELARKGIATLRFDFSGNGESQGVFEFGNYYKEVQDIRSAVVYVRSGLGKKVLAVVGHSKGGNNVLLYASQYDGDVEFIINVAGRYDMKRGVKERFGEDIFDRLERLGHIKSSVKTSEGATVPFMLTKASMAERMGLDMAAAASKISISEVLTIHGTADPTIPVEDAHSFAKVISTHTLTLVEGADHSFRNAAHADIAIKRIVDYLTSGL